MPGALRPAEYRGETQFDKAPWEDDFELPNPPITDCGQDEKILWSVDPGRSSRSIHDRTSATGWSPRSSPSAGEVSAALLSRLL